LVGPKRDGDVTCPVGATLKGSCVPTLKSIQLEGCHPQPKRSRRCWRDGDVTCPVRATLKGSCVPTLESIQLEGCRSQPKRSRRCWRRLGGCWMLSGCLRQPDFGSPSPPQRGPERPCVGKCHRGADEKMKMPSGPKDAVVDVSFRDLSCRLDAQVGDKEASC
jgi:hypothetical protein